MAEWQSVELLWKHVLELQTSSVPPITLKFKACNHVDSYGSHGQTLSINVDLVLNVVYGVIVFSGRRSWVFLSDAQFGGEFCPFLSLIGLSDYIPFLVQANELLGYFTLSHTHLPWILWQLWCLNQSLTWRNEVLASELEKLRQRLCLYTME